MGINKLQIERIKDVSKKNYSDFSSIFSGKLFFKEYHIFPPSQKFYAQNQPPISVPRKSCSKNMQEISRRTPMPKCDFNKSNFIEITLRHGCSHVKLLCNFIEITLRYGCSSVSLLDIFTTPFLRTPLDSCFCMQVLHVYIIPMFDILYCF